MKTHYSFFLKLKGFILLFSLILMYQFGNAQGTDYDWKEKIQLYGHGFSVPTDFTTTEFEYIANTFKVFTVEKRHAYDSYGGSPSTERATIGTAATLKAINPDIEVLLYWNAVMNYETLYEYNAEFGAHPEWVHSIWPTGYEIYDLGNIACQDWWVDSIVEIIEDGDLDGVFLDAGPKVEASGLSAAWNTAIDRVRARIGYDKTVIYNGYRVASPTTIQAGQDISDHTSGVFIEFFLHAPLDTKEEAALLFDNLTDAYNDGKQIFPRGTPSSYLPGTAAADRFQFSFASFMLFYGPNSYWIYNDGYNKTDGMFDYYPEYYDIATGESLGGPQRNGWVYTREFENYTITVDLENLTSSIVKRTTPSAVSISPSSATLTSVGATQSLSATVSPAGATNKSVTWSSSNSNVASVNSTGLVTAHGAGSATITATTNEGGFTDTSIITVSLSSGGGNNNLALNGTATQSSTANSGDASRAIDGNTNGAWSGGSVTHTASGAGNWWQVDLGSNKTIGEINVFGRTDACCIARLSDYTISVINSSGVTTYSKTYTSYPDPSVTTNAGNVQGKIVKIQLNVTSALSLAEVQVFEGVSCATFTRIEGETYNAMSGVDIRNSLDTGGGQMVGQIHNGDWCKYNNVDLTCATSVDARVASFQVGGDIEVRIDGVTGTLIGTISQGTTGGWQNWVTASANITQVSGVHDVYLVFKGGSAALFNFNWFEFSNNGQQAKSALTKSADQLNSNTNKPFLIYPNPATNKLNIELSNIAESTKINIFNSIGQMVISDELINEIHTVDISKLPGGMYVIKVSDKNNEQVLTQKFIKQ